jgi:hypothetical protein
LGGVKTLDAATGLAIAEAKMIAKADRVILDMSLTSNKLMCLAAA